MFIVIVIVSVHDIVGVLDSVCGVVIVTISLVVSDMCMVSGSVIGIDMVIVTVSVL